MTYHLLDGNLFFFLCFFLSIRHMDNRWFMKVLFKSFKSMTNKPEQGTGTGCNILRHLLIWFNWLPLCYQKATTVSCLYADCPIMKMIILGYLVLPFTIITMDKDTAEASSKTNIRSLSGYSRLNHSTSMKIREEIRFEGSVFFLTSEDQSRKVVSYFL